MQETFNLHHLEVNQMRKSDVPMLIILILGLIIKFIIGFIKMCLEVAKSMGKNS